MMKSIHHICIQTENYIESLDFYTRILGFDLVKETPNFHGRDFNAWLKIDGFMIELQTPKKGDSFQDWSSLNKGPVHMGFLVADLEKEYERILALGYRNFKKKNGQILYEVFGRGLIKIKAPEGTEIELRDTDIE